MAPSLRDLIDFLLGEIALCGDQGASPADILNFIHAFYAKAAQDGSSHRKHTVDRRFQEKVWSWLTRNPEVSVGKNREGNHLTLADVEHSMQHDQGNDKSPEVSSQTPMRVFVSEERTWLAITGHERDENKVFLTEFALLSIIASRKSAGIVQTELVKLSGQDKRSVPKRTDMLQQKGYIDKRAIQIKAARTSLCTLRRFRKTDNAPVAGSSDQQPEGRQGVDVIDFKEFTDKLFQILRQYKIVSRNDLKNLLGFADHWRWRVLSRSVRKFERIGVLKRVKALSQYADTMNKYHPCVMLIREPTQRDFEMFNEFSLNLTTDLGQEDSVELDEDVEPNDAGRESSSLSGPQTMVKREEDVEEAGRMVPAWNPEQNIHNLIFDTVDRAGTSGITNVDILRTCFGGFFRRPLENALTRLVACWQLSQPLHLRQLAIVRDTALSRTITHYVHYSANNFRQIVDAGGSTWEAVEFVPKTTKSNHVKVPPVDAVPKLNEHGFSVAVPAKELLKNGNATLLECILVVRPASYSCTNTDPVAVQLEGNTYGIRFGDRKSNLEVSRRDKYATPSRPKVKHQDISDIEMEDVPPSRRYRKPKDDPDRFRGMSEKEKLEALGLDETWTEYSVLLIDRSQPGVYITPRGRRRPAGKRQGRPRISRIAVFKSPGLASFPWFLQEKRAEEDHETISTPRETPQAQSIESIEPKPGAETILKPSTARSELPEATPTRGTKRNLRQRASINAESDSAAGRTHKQRRLMEANVDPPEVIASDVQGSENLNHKRNVHEVRDQSSSMRRSKRRKIESPTSAVPKMPTTASKMPGYIEQADSSAVMEEPRESLQPSGMDLDNYTPSEHVNGLSGQSSSIERANGAVPENFLEPGDSALETPVAVNNLDGLHDAGEKHPLAAHTSEGPQQNPKKQEKGGSVYFLRRKIIMDIIEQAGGAFPLGKELWYPFATAWLKMKYKERPDLRTIKTTVKHMVDAGKLRQHTFSGKDSKGIMVTKAIVSKTDLDPDAPLLKEMQKNILASDPRQIYIPSSVEYDRALTKRGRKAMPSDDLKPIPQIPVEPGVTVQLHRKPAQVVAQERRKGLSIQRRLLQRLEPETDSPRKPMRLMTIQRPSTDDSAMYGLTSISRPGPGGSSEVSGRLPRRHRTTAPGGLIPRRQVKRLWIPISSMTPYAMLMNPKQVFHEGSGTFSTYAGLMSLHMPQSLKEKKKKKEKEEVEVRPGLPKSLDELFKKARRRTVNYSDRTDPRSRKFFLDTNVILRWELQNEELLQNQTPEDASYINQTVANLFSAPIEGDIRFDRDQAEPPVASPPEPKTTRRRAQQQQRQEEHQEPAEPPTLQPSVPESAASTTPEETPQLEIARRNRRLNQLIQREAAGPQTPAPSGSRQLIRRNRMAGQLPDQLVQRVMVAIAVVRSLASGYDARLVDWNLVSRCFPDDDPEFIQDRAKMILSRNRLQISKMLSDFEERFIEAYANDQVPPINYDDLDSYNWEWVVNWAYEQLDTPRSGRLPDLPATREQFDSVFEIREEPITSLDDIYQSSHGITINRRRTLFAGVPFATPLADQPVRTTARQMELARLEVAKTWVRANVVTPEGTYRPAAARDALEQLGDDLVGKALQSLITERVLYMVNKGRDAPGRNYDISEHFLQVLGRKRSIEAAELRRAAQFKTQVLDQALQQHGTFDVPYNAEDGDILAMINLFAEGRIILTPRDPPRDKYGLTDGGYLTRLIDKDKLRFSVEVRPTRERYVYGDPIQEKTASIPPPCVPNLRVDSADDVPEKIPLWYDIHGQLVPVLWELALVAVVGCVATRPGINALGIANMMKPCLGAWEVERL
ncbi:putative TFIIIC transcription initiation factor complex subunits Tfc3 [Aspergillus tanneri]|uniref:Uncharacterized protein n=1 Tax=Aspergillus tanneri TaxID=1220188 RepID=A0A5M9MQK9_9EURO|nr:uncharacterized protein ATNIH1004_004079 [Aspergillus tanneri]KAA8648196.1 hypothetical protein ATNIH1004_004079 [Aspergillus tanneri]